MPNKHLIKRQQSVVKDDEFYTRLCDIETELVHYNFEGKIVYCPCDDYLRSNFCKYFIDNFDKLKLKKLYCSGILDKKAFAFNGKDSKIIQLKEGGDFRSKECLTILEHSDIVVTNPPFSLLKDFIPLYTKKEFILIVPTLALCYSYIKPYILSWHVGKETGMFIRPDDTNKHQACFFISNINTNRDRKAVLVNKPISEYSFVTYKDNDYLWTENINNIPDNYYEPMFVPMRYIIIRDDRFRVIEASVSPYNSYTKKKLFRQCLIQRIK